MAECQNFFDDTSPRACRSSSSIDQSPPTTRNESAEHGLELRLGPSVDANKPKQPEMVRPIPLYPSLDKQRSGNFAHAVENSPLFLGHNDVAMADKALSKDSAFSTPPRISREQVWQTLEKTNAVLSQQDACASRAFCDDAALSMWSRRSASMQIMMPSSELSEADVCPIRRSCSNGFVISRQSSLSQEALVDESPSPTNLRPFNQQDALELQKRREMQAQRRLEARKRRRLLMEAKHQKKARQNSGVINMHSPQMEKDLPLHSRAKDRNCALQTHPKTQHANLCAKREDNQDLKGGYARGDVRTEEHPLVKGGVLNKPSDESDNNDFGNSRKHIEGDLTGMQSVVESGSLSVPATHESSLAGKSAGAIEGIKPTPSSCSETESTETKGRECCKDMDLSERESSSQKSSTENRPEQSGLAKASHSKPMLYPRALSRSGSGIPTVPTSFASPRSTQHLPADSDGFHTSHLTSSACKSPAASGDMVSNSFATVKKSVGVFCEGKWKTLDEKSAFLPLRRTTSNVIEAATDPQCSAKQLEDRVSVAMPQQKFARMGIDTTAGTSHRNKMDALRENFSCATRLNLHDIKVKEELDTEEENPVIGLKGAAPTGDMSSEMITSGMLKAKVKQEEDPTGFDHQLLNKRQQPEAGSAPIGAINRQRSASFLDLPRVTTTGRGPNGRTINGVMYITSGRSVWLVCRCHGKHMSPAEFVEHSGSTDLSNPLKNIVVNPPLLFNQIASTPG